MQLKERQNLGRRCNWRRRYVDGRVKPGHDGDGSLKLTGFVAGPTANDIRAMVAFSVCARKPAKTEILDDKRPIDPEETLGCHADRLVMCAEQS